MSFNVDDKLVAKGLTSAVVIVEAPGWSAR
jgi:hypothetical protein